MPADKLEAIHDVLYQAVYKYNIGIITAGDWMTNMGDGSPLTGDAYSNMKQILGIGRVDGEGPVAATLTAADVAHTVMQDYIQGETVISYDANRWYNYFEPVPGQNVAVLAEQTVTGNAPGTYDAVLASETGGRNVHFATLEFMGDPNLLWSALQWVIYGDQPAVSLKMGRHNNLFVSRNDMDQTQFIDEVADNDGALLPLLQQWKTDYNFVGSYFINIGNNPASGELTDWSYSGPLYRDYIALGNEIGTHSYTHPHETNILTPAEIDFEFNQSMNEIAANLNPTWRNQNIRGAAVPGAPEGLDTASEIIQYVDYLTGGYSGVGSGYPGAFGYPTPEMDKVYFSPNMVFDFTLIEFGIPVLDPASGQFVPVPLTAAEAETYWINQYTTLMGHANQPIIHWPWHDYGPTTGTWDDPNDPSDDKLYSVSMFSNTIAAAFNDNAEFATSADVAQRITTFADAALTVDYDNSAVTV
ncbi:MAG: polysaccharide deacetylase, partial [Candidatus Electrothrix sp. AR4]|nr:polysaccharide deacetylase [Candidatus Electrothrix sp. AR4]